MAAPLQKHIASASVVAAANTPPSIRVPQAEASTHIEPAPPPRTASLLHQCRSFMAAPLQNRFAGASVVAAASTLPSEYWSQRQARTLSQSAPGSKVSASHCRAAASLLHQCRSCMAAPLHLQCVMQPRSHDKLVDFIYHASRACSVGASWRLRCITHCRYLSGGGGKPSPI